MSTTPIEENKELVHEYLAAWDNEDPAALSNVLADDFETTHESMTGTERQLDLEGFQELMAEELEAFSDVGSEIHDLVAEEDTVIARLTFDGVHDGEFLGVEPTGKRLEVEEYITFYIEDGEIVDLTNLADGVSLLRQLDLELPV